MARKGHSSERPLKYGKGHHSREEGWQHGVPDDAKLAQTVEACSCTNDIPVIHQAIGLIAGRTAQEYNHRKKRRGAFWKDRYHATAIESGEHLLRCLVYIDLNMVRAGAVDHPSKWPHGGYNEIQAPRRKNIIIAYYRLRELAGFKDYDAFAPTHCKWVQSALEKIDNKRQSRWTESVVVGSMPFIERIKNAMRVMVKGRLVQSTEEAFELRETQSAYNAIFDSENRKIDPIDHLQWVAGICSIFHDQHHEWS